MLQVMIRRATTEDVGGITAVIRSPDLFPRILALTETETNEQIARQLAACLTNPSHSVYIAESVNTVVGYVSVHWLPYLILHGPEGFVSELFLKDGTRGQGIGRKLLDAVVEEAKERGCTRLHLINMRNRESYQRGFYTKTGWTERPDAASFIYVL